MCNYATTSLTFCSRNVGMLKKLHKKIWNCYSLVPHKNLVRDLLNSHDYTTTEQETLTNRTDYISHCDKTVSDRGCVFFFSCELICAWHGNLQAIVSLLSKEYYDEIRLSFCSEEPGAEEYLIHDETGVFYLDRFKVDWCFQNNYEIKYFSTFFQVIDYLHAVFPKANLSYYDSLEEVERQVALAYQEQDENYFLYIHRFSDNDTVLTPNKEEEAA